MNDTPLLEVHDLSIRFRTEDGPVDAVQNVSLCLHPGEVLAIVGESGSGKSVTALSLTRLLPTPPTEFVSGKILLEGRDVLRLPSRELRRIRGGRIAYIFQEPSTSLNPVYTIRSQIAEAIRIHRPDVTDIDAEIVQWLTAVGIPDPARRMHAYPHQFSGGMQQRAMIAMALSCRPKILVADEPTTALDVTIQAQIIDELRRLQAELGMAVILITHNFGIVKGFAQRVAVMYRGRIVEEGPTDSILNAPRHPYTRALIDCIPRLGGNVRRLRTIDHAEIESALAASEA